MRGAAHAGGAGDRPSRVPRRDAAGDPARRERPPVQCPCGWWLLWVWSLPLSLGELCVPAARGRLQCLQVSVFANRSWARTDGLARLGDLQAYGWSNDSDAIRFLKPWARGSVSQRQWDELQNTLSVYRNSFTRDMQELVKMLRLDCEPGWDPGAAARRGLCLSLCSRRPARASLPGSPLLPGRSPPLAPQAARVPPVAGPPLVSWDSGSPVDP